VRDLQDNRTDNSDVGGRAERRLIIAVAAIILAGICARAWLMFGTPFVPGMNGGYYLVQARAIIEKGALGIPDLPLIFALQAALALLIRLLTGNGLENSILLAVKLADSILPPLAAWPVFLIGMQWSRRFGRGPWLALTGAACVALSAPALSMVGDFEKNSLGLMWLAWLLWALLAWMNGSRRAAVGAVALLGLVGLTHISVFGTALVLVTLVFAAHLVLQPRSLAQMPWRWIAGSAAAVVLAGGVVFWKFDPARVGRLLGAIKNPVAFMQGGGPPGMPGSVRPPAQRNSDFRGGPPKGGPPMMPGIPGLSGLPSWAPGAAIAGVMALPFFLALRRRNGLLPGDRELAIGCALGVIAITGPWVGGDKLMRLALNAVIPAVIAGEFALLHIRRCWLRALLGGLAFAGIVGSSVPMLLRGGRPILSDEALHELQSLTPQITDPSHTLISAQHGAEWWTAWFLHTHVAQAQALRADDWQKFDVLFLEVKRGAQFGPGGPGFGPGRGQRNGPGAGRDRDFGPPPGFAPPDGPNGMAGGPPMGALGMPPGGMGRGVMPPMMGPSIPADAKILHEGPCLRLARVATPPDSVKAMEGQAETGVAP
jgi:hypothetical protein